MSGDRNISKKNVFNISLRETYEVIFVRRIPYFVFYLWPSLKLTTDTTSSHHQDTFCLNLQWKEKYQVSTFQLFRDNSCTE